MMDERPLSDTRAELHVEDSSGWAPGRDWEAEVETWPWRFASSMPHIPHWYVMRAEALDDKRNYVILPEVFEAFERHLNEHGTRARWRAPSGRMSPERSYLTIGRYQYWIIGETINRDEGSKVYPVSDS